MGKPNTTTPDQKHINDVHAKLSAKADELVQLVIANVDTKDAKFTSFQNHISDAMTVILTCPVK